MKKSLSIILAFVFVLSCTACGQKPSESVTTTPTPKPVEESTVNPGEMLPETVLPETEGEEGKETAKPTPTVKPTEAPTAEPSEAPTATPAPTEAPAKTVGNILLDAFKANAANKDALGLAEMLITNPIIPFMGGAMPVEPGFLTGFDNTEITGFTSGAMFAPMIGTQPFVGYVFELASANETAAFISKLESSANLRWNICTSAEEMVSGAVGNKVFFVMCLRSFDEA